MQSLATLIKLQKTRVDEQQTHLSRLQARLDEILSKIAELEITIAREQVAAQENQELQLTYGAFIKASIELGRFYEKERQTASDAVEIARNQLSELFEEQKRYEIAEESWIASVQLEERKRETNQMDEVGSIGFIRNKERR